MIGAALRGNLLAVIAICAFAGTASAARAAPLEPTLQTQLLGIYDHYNQAVVAGKLDQAIALRDSETRGEMRQDLDKPGERAGLLAFARVAIPDSIDVLHATLSNDGATATVLVMAHKKQPADAPRGTPSESEVTLTFVKEAGAWTFGEQMFGMAPSQIKACKNQAFEPIEAYDQDTNTSLGGPIARVAFETDHTLLIVRVLNEENCVFLPGRAELQKSGFDTAQLVPYAIVEVDGFAHRSDKQKMWADHVKMSEQ
jgi:hypothetical protein